MSSAPTPATRLHRTRRIFFLLAFFPPALVVALVFANSYINAGSVLLRVGDSKADSFLARYGTHAVTIAARDIQTPVGTIKTKFYNPVGVSNPPAMVVLHGVHHLGIDEPRLTNFALALSSHGILVMTPEMADLADYHVEPQAIDVIGLSAQDLKRRTGAEKISVLGLSFAGGLALVAAADPRYANDIGVVASIGGHDDLARVLRYFATNSIEHPDGHKWTVPAHEYGVLVVAYSHPEDFFSSQDVELARQALRQQLYENPNAAEVIAIRLSPSGHDRMRLLLEHRTDVLSSDLLSALQEHEAEARFVSPAGKLSKLKADVFLAHGAGDNVIPPTETEWLAREVPSDKLKFVLISPVISHVELGKQTSFADEWHLVHFMEEFLRDSTAKARSHHAVDLPPRSQVPATQ